jgi:hypothetical protein
MSNVFFLASLISFMMLICSFLLFCQFDFVAYTPKTFRHEIFCVHFLSRNQVMIHIKLFIILWIVKIVFSQPSIGSIPCVEDSFFDVSFPTSINGNLPYGLVNGFIIDGDSTMWMKFKNNGFSNFHNMSLDMVVCNNPVCGTSVTTTASNIQVLMCELAWQGEIDLFYSILLFISFDCSIFKILSNFGLYFILPFDHLLLLFFFFFSFDY